MFLTAKNIHVVDQIYRTNVMHNGLSFELKMRRRHPGADSAYVRIWE